MSIVDKRTIKSVKPLRGKISTKEDGYFYQGDSKSELKSSRQYSARMSDLNADYKTEDTRGKRKISSKFHEGSMSLRRPPKRLERFDRTLSVSLEDLLQGINETKSPPGRSEESTLVFPTRVISAAGANGTISDIAEEYRPGRNGYLSTNNRKSKTTYNDCVFDFSDANNNPKHREPVASDVIGIKKEGLKNSDSATYFQNKRHLPHRHTNLEANSGMDYISSDKSRTIPGDDNTHSQKRSLATQSITIPPKSLQFSASQIARSIDADSSPTSNEVHDILRHVICDVTYSDVESSSSGTDTEDSDFSSRSASSSYKPEFCTQLSSLTLVPSDDDTIIGCHGEDGKLKVSRPRCAKEIQKDTLLSGCVLSPGCRDINQRPVLFIRCSIINEHPSIGKIEITRLMLYLASNASYMTLVISEASAKSWSIVEESIVLFQENRSGTLSKIVVITKKDDFHPNVDQFMAECVVIRKKSELPDFVKMDNIPKVMGGDFEYYHSDWVKRRMDVESYVLLCERLQHNFASHTLAIAAATAPSSARETNATLSKHRSTMTALLDDPRVRDLHNRGHRFMKDLSKVRNPENRSYAEQIQSSYESVCSSIRRYVQSADERLLSLEKRVLVQQFEESCDRIVSWATDRKDELSNKFGEVADSLNELKIQRQEFYSFYLDVVKQYAQCDCLLSEANQLSSSGFLGQVNSQARNAAKKISEVVQDMEMKKEEVETASQLFLFVDQAYSWALSGMKFVASLSMKESMSVEELEDLIMKYDEYMSSHPMIPTEEFARMQRVAVRFQNVKCQRQCEIAQQKCTETRDLFVQRRRLIVKARDRQVHERRKKEGAQSPDSEKDSGIAESRRGPSPATTDSSTEDPARDRGSAKPKCRAILRQSSDVSHRLNRAAAVAGGAKNGVSPLTLQDVNENGVAPGAAGKHRPKKMLRKSQSMSAQHSKLKIGAPMRAEQPDTKGRTKWSLAIEELITTEEEYVKSLNYIIEHYYPLMNQIEDVPQALRGKRGVVFGNIENICDFHAGRFLEALRECHDQPGRVAEVFKQHSDSFGMYALYSKNKPRSDELMTEHGSKFFRSKQLSLRDKMDLSSYLLKPVQRMGKYALLLHNIAKHSEVQYRAQLREAEALVKFQLRHGNDLLSMDSIVNCDVNLKEQGELLRQDEFMVFQGRRKFIRHVFLFSDLILFCKPQKVHGGHDVYHYKSSYKTVEVGLTENIGDSGLKFEIWFRRPMQDSIILHLNGAHKKQAWVDDIRSILWNQAMKNKANRRNEMANMGVGSKPHLDIHSSESPITERSVATERLMAGRVLTSRCRASIAVTYEHGSKRPHSTVSTSSTSSNGSLQLNPQPSSMFDFRAILEGEEYESGSGQGSSVCMSNSEPDVLENRENQPEALSQQYVTTV